MAAASIGNIWYEVIPFSCMARYEKKSSLLCSFIKFLQSVVLFYLGFMEDQLINIIIERQTQLQYTSLFHYYAIILKREEGEFMFIEIERRQLVQTYKKRTQYLKNIMVKTTSELQSSQQNQHSLPVGQAKPTKKTLKLFSYAFPKPDSPYYFDNLPYFRQQYQKVQSKMKDVNRITFKINDKQKSFIWIKPQPQQYQPSQQSQSEIYSRASTQIKVDHSQMKKCMSEFDQQQNGFNKAHLMQQSQEIMEQCSYVSSCISQDIEIYQKVASIQSRDNQMRSYQQQVEINHREENSQIFEQEILPNQPQVDNQVAFGPLNIDDLSTNQTLNPNSRSIQMQQANINHIFIENAQNIFENLSEMSTKACMSHIEHSFNEVNSNYLTQQEEYNEILWNAQQNLPYYITLGNEQLNLRIHNYLSLMLELKTRQTNRNLNKEEREEFLSLMTIIGFSFHSVTFDKMSQLVIIYQENEPNSNDFEYYLIKERIESMNFLSNSQIYQF